MIFFSSDSWLYVTKDSRRHAVGFLFLQESTTSTWLVHQASRQKDLCLRHSPDNTTKNINEEVIFKRAEQKKIGQMLLENLHGILKTTTHPEASLLFWVIIASKKCDPFNPAA